jgi:hypothetical protein
MVHQPKAMQLKQNHRFPLSEVYPCCGRIAESLQTESNRRDTTHRWNMSESLLIRSQFARKSLLSAAESRAKAFDIYRAPLF